MLYKFKSFSDIFFELNIQTENFKEKIENEDLVKVTINYEKIYIK